jgi:putative membrane-bound dehydrogenase-like protein
MKRLGAFLIAFAVPGVGLFSGFAADAPQPPPPKSPTVPEVRTNQQDRFQVKSGFRVELVAGGDLVEAPVALAFDENGRLFVAEMRDYFDRRGLKPSPGRIRLLEDADEDGVFDTSTVFADDLVAPSAIACANGGVFVAAGNEILFLRDTAGGDRANVRNVVFTGFGSATNVGPHMLFPNHMRWGLDNRVHLGTAGLGGTVSAASPGPFPAVPLSDSDFAFDPRDFRPYAEAGTGQSSVCFDNFGRRFVSDFSRPLRQVVFESRFLEANPFFAAPPALVDVASPATGIYQIQNVASPNQPANLPLSEMESSAIKTTIVMSSGWLANVRSALLYRSAAFPTNYQGNLFAADPEAHVIHREIVRPSGLSFVSQRAPDDRNSEFLLSRDPSFRPMHLAEGPEGALYIADMGSAMNRGRIYRVSPVDARKAKPPRLGKCTTYELAGMLASFNSWQRETAARLLYQRRDPFTAGLLTNIVQKSKIPLARIHALRLLEGLDALREPEVLTGLRDPDENVREQAILAARTLARREQPSDVLWLQFRQLSVDPSIRIRLAVALALGEMQRGTRNRMLAEILRRDPANPWIRYAVLCSSGAGAPELINLLVFDPRFRPTGLGNDFLDQLATMTGVRGQLPEAVAGVNAATASGLPPAVSFSLLASVGEGLRNTSSSLGLLDPEKKLAPFYTGALNNALDGTMPLPSRVAAIRLMGVSPAGFTDLSEWLRYLLAPGEPAPIYGAALEAVGKFNDPRLLPDFVQRWPTFTPAVRLEALNALLGRGERVGPLVSLLEKEPKLAAALPPAMANFLRSFHDPVVRQRALALLGPIELRRPTIIQQYSPALRLKGNAKPGREIFLARCSACHRLGGEGFGYGPNLVGAKVLGRETVLERILEPSGSTARGYETWTAETRTGDTLYGLKQDQAGVTSVFYRPGRQPVVLPKENLIFLTEQPWSMMPAGLEAGLSAQNIADLLEFLMSAGP